MLKYDEKQLAAGLERLEPRRRVAFAAACCERLLPSYDGDPAPLRAALDALWDERPAPAVAEEDEDPAAAVFYARETALTGAVQTAVWAARRAYEAVDSLVELDFDDEARILADPRVQHELACQAADLELLTQADDAVAVLRARTTKGPGGAEAPPGP